MGFMAYYLSLEASLLASAKLRELLKDRPNDCGCCGKAALGRDHETVVYGKDRYLFSRSKLSWGYIEGPNRQLGVSLTNRSQDSKTV